MTRAAPLDGVTVLDFTQIELGPCATQVLGDFGADVIKIERPGVGDPLRFYMQTPSGESAVFWGLNRNKRSVAIDLKSPLGREAIYRLARRADVLVHNFRPGVMERLGFGYDDLRAINPRLVYAFGTGYGPTGPYRDKGGQDVLAQAMSGVAARRNDPHAPPDPCASWGRSRRSASRSSSKARPAPCASLRPGWASTRARCWPRSASHPKRSRWWWTAGPANAVLPGRRRST